MIRNEIRERFFALTQETVDGCIEWLGPSRPLKGNHKELYFGVGKRVFQARRLAWSFATGSTPQKRLYHKCNNHLCINPKHHKLGS